eukprot:45300-Eustigmatos_ZCMA.PRE.1
MTQLVHTTSTHPLDTSVHNKRHWSIIHGVHPVDCAGTSVDDGGVRDYCGRDAGRGAFEKKRRVKWRVATDSE